MNTVHKLEEEEEEEEEEDIYYLWVAGQIGPKQNRPQVKSAPGQIVPSNWPQSNRPHVIYLETNLSKSIKSKITQLRMIYQCSLFKYRAG